MTYQPSKKTRLVAAVAATLAFTGTLVAFAHAQEEATVEVEYRIISTRETCVDYVVGQVISIRVPASFPEQVLVNLGGENDGIIAQAVDPEA